MNTHLHLLGYDLICNECLFSSIKYIIDGTLDAWNMYGNIKLQSQKYSSLAFVLFIITITILVMLFLLSSLYTSHKAFAVSPAFDEVLISDQELKTLKSHWIQTYGNDSTHLKSGYANLSAVNYQSDGKTLDATFWLASNSENASTYSQPFKKIRYGMLIAIVSLPQNSGYNGANYDYYVEAANGKWSEYLYKLSSTGSRMLLTSRINYTQPFGTPTIGRGYINLRLDLGSIKYPTKYGLSFYTAESYKSNEVRDYSPWIAVPPATISILTNPKNVAIRQGEERLVPAEIGTEFSNNVTSITFDTRTSFTSSGLNVSAQRIQPPLFKINVSPNATIGVYRVPLTASLLISTTSSAFPSLNDTATGYVDPEFQVSKKYPTIGYITSPANLTVSVIPAVTFHETFVAFWSTYGTPLAILAGGAVGAFSTVIVEYARSRRIRKQNK